MTSMPELAKLEAVALALEQRVRRRANSVLGELGNFFSPEFMNRF